MFILRYYKTLFASKYLRLQVINDFTLSMYFVIGGIWDFEDNVGFLLNIFIPNFNPDTYVQQTTNWRNNNPFNYGAVGNNWDNSYE